MPIVSLIVPIFNAEVYLERCLLSIQQQVFSGYEVLLINDGSTDASQAICDRFVASDHRFHLTTTPNRGEAAARNLGISLAKSEYITFVDADDEVTPTYLNDLVNDAQQSNADLVMHGNYRIREKKRITNGFEHSRIYDLPAQADHLFSSINIVHHGSVWAKLFKLSVIQDYHFAFSEDVRLAVDLCFVIDYLSHTQRVAISNKVNYHYYLMVNQALSTCYWNFATEERGFCRLEQSWNRLLQRYPSKGLQNAYSEFVGNYVNRMVYTALTHPYQQADRKINLEHLHHAYMPLYASKHHPTSLYTRCLKYCAFHRYYLLYLLAVKLVVMRYHLVINYR